MNNKTNEFPHLSSVTATTTTDPFVVGFLAAEREITMYIVVVQWSCLFLFLLLCCYCCIITTTHNHDPQPHHQHRRRPFSAHLFRDIFFRFRSIEPAIGIDPILASVCVYVSSSLSSSN